MPSNTEQNGSRNPVSRTVSTNYPPGVVCGGPEAVHNDKELPIVIPDTPDAYVHHGTWMTGPEVNSLDSPLYYVGTEDGSKPPDSTRNQDTAQTSQHDRSRKKKLCLILVILVLLIGAVVGGALGGTIGQRSKNASTTPASMSNGSISATSASTRASLSTITSMITSPSKISEFPPISTTRERLEFKMTVWEFPNYEGRSQTFFTPGGFRTAFLARSYWWFPGVWDEDKLRCSMGFCFNNEEVGWWGITERQQPGQADNDTWGGNYIHIVCQEEFKDPGCPNAEEAVTFTTAPVFDTTTLDPLETAGPDSSFTTPAITESTPILSRK
ncbi:hypothetical protein CC78DRAFT_583731 [Lojkania enalia]|uniref:Uncharacterized protein n=1 Tax=Lojkania enalia TaxID=147567 RepID=A0A9P4K3U4_9PLEO|nr:hypothetical protein CC78DRAFT_583731 [Didymosphaeria enalia]